MSRPAVVGRSLRLALGTLTALPVPAVLRVTPGVATGALVLAPLAVLPLGALVGLAVWAGGETPVPSLAVAFVALALLALGSRALHLDGLSDVADGLTASYDRLRSLAVMKGGTAGPAGVVAVVLVLGVQAAALATFVGGARSAVIAGTAVCASRAALWITCAGPVPPARPDGLGSTFTRRVPVWWTLLGWAALAGAAALVHPWRGPLAVGLAAFVVLLLVVRAVRRFGGVTGDVFGATIELALATLLLALAGHHN
ncbi:adenosylcobinamide-GDP ribazoletransferase [Nocardioides sp. HM23]|uniref:adenosylcobinamide-GDP ribazoletransferase n=1 Tax=Nocardioides bizhenqiangii TaxID=3095076 RepID=UPI002ACA6BBB|nr:adenosylcobinamide-GDP ribazoletransferase [Nocardioides sp. HM23]MDZ5622494.1 adenosylcobinamide-GDP ribazoletransferase [Nocardioides sp. HM23]